MRPLSTESVFNKASSQCSIPTCELHRRELRNGGNRGTPEGEGGGPLPLHPSCYYLYGIAKHASGNQHEIVNCSAHLCVAQGTGPFRRSRIERVRGARLSACASGLSRHIVRRRTRQNHFIHWLRLRTATEWHLPHVLINVSRWLRQSSKRTPPLVLHAQPQHNAPPSWLSVLFLLEEREKEQGYAGRHINGACHAR